MFYDTYGPTEDAQSMVRTVGPLTNFIDRSCRDQMARGSGPPQARRCTIVPPPRKYERDVYRFANSSVRRAKLTSCRSLMTCVAHAGLLSW